MSLEQLKRANPSVSYNYLQVGMKINIPNISDYIAGTLEYYAVRNPEADRELISDFATYSFPFLSLNIILAAMEIL